MRPAYLPVCLLLAAALGACTRPDPTPGTGTLVLRLDTLDTRGGYTEEQAWEKRLRQYNASGTSIINGVQVLIYDSKGVLELNLLCSQSQSAEYSLSTGKKYVYVLCGCERVGYPSIFDLRAHLLTLGNTRGEFLPMRWYGMATVSGDGPVTVDATLRRTVARVALTGLHNNLRTHQAVESSYAFIGRARVKMDIAMEGTSEDHGLVNTDWSSGLTLAEATAQSDLTGIQLGSVDYGASLTGLPKCLYSYPGTGLSDSELPVLVVAAKIAGTWYYGEIPLGTLKPNNTYSVDVTLQETGPEFPTQIVVSYSIRKWETGDFTTAQY